LNFSFEEYEANFLAGDGCWYFEYLIIEFIKQNKL
jgi:hypothetical protein